MTGPARSDGALAPPGDGRHGREDGDRADRYRTDLPTAMAVDVPGVRSAIPAPSTLPPLRHLPAFRHFFRHAYSVTLDPAKIEALAREQVRADGALRSDPDRLEADPEAAGKP